MRYITELWNHETNITEEVIYWRSLAGASFNEFSPAESGWELRIVQDDMRYAYFINTEDDDRRFYVHNGFANPLCADVYPERHPETYWPKWHTEPPPPSIEREAWQASMMPVTHLHPDLTPNEVLRGPYSQYGNFTWECEPSKRSIWQRVRTVDTDGRTTSAPAYWYNARLQSAFEPRGNASACGNWTLESVIDPRIGEPQQSVQMSSLTHALG